MTRLVVSAMILTLACAGAGRAQDDPRLQVLPYRAGSVVTLHVVPGYVSTVILRDDERIETVAVGNTAAWEVIASKSGDHLFVKPLTAGVATNLEVVTSARHYSFVLRSTVDGDPQAAFQLRFTYPAVTPTADLAAPEGMVSAPAPGTAPAAAAAADSAIVAVGRYRVSGARLARPIAIEDDGVRTRFVFADAAALPAIYAIDDQGRELLVTIRRDAESWVLDRVWQRYTLRNGKATAHARRMADRPS